MERQIDYGRQRGVPWGISESAYAFTDREGTYQYRAFGVPGLGLKRGLVTDLVDRAVRDGAGEPRVTPADAADNFERLASARRSKAATASTNRSTTPRAIATSTVATDAAPRPVVVRAYFAHHQGMSLVALANVVCQDVFVARFHADPRIQATELLLQERVPREAILSEPRPAEAATAPPSLPVFASRRFRVAADDQRAHAFPVERPLHRRRSPTPAAATACGATWRSRAGATTRRRMPAVTTSTCAIPGRAGSGRRRISRSASEPDRFEATFDLDKITFRRRDGDIETQLDITVSSEDDVEVRRLTITNRGAQTREIEVTSYAEIVLAGPRTTSRIPPSASCSSRPSSIRRAPACSSAAGRARPTSRPLVAFHVLGVDGPRLGGARRMGNRPRAVHRPRPLAGQPDRRSTAARCRARPARCSIRSARCASAFGWARRHPSA